MKGGLALLLGGKPKGMGMSKDAPMPDDEAIEAAPDSEAGEGGTKSAYAKLVIDAMSDGDSEGAAKALVELVNCCK